MIIRGNIIIDVASYCFLSKVLLCNTCSHIKNIYCQVDWKGTSNGPTSYTYFAILTVDVQQAPLCFVTEVLRKVLLLDNKEKNLGIPFVFCSLLCTFARELEISI